jgi:hypothetical protein
METLVAVFGWFLAILIVSNGMIIWYRKIRTTELKIMIDIILLIGVVIHELAHATVLISMRIIPNKFSVRYRSRLTGQAAPHGGVGLRDEDSVKMTFMQGFFASLAPLFVSTFVFLFMLDVIYNMNSTDGMKLLAWIVIVSVMFGSAPSHADLYSMMQKFYLRPEYSLYQVILAIGSILIVIFYVDLSFLILPFEVINYIVYCLAAIGIYFVLKGSVIFIKETVGWIYRKKQSHKHLYVSYNRSFFKRKPKPFKPKRSEREEVHW